MAAPEDDRRAIEELLSAYAERLDAGDFEGVGALFAHAEIATADAGPAIRGREAVARLYAATVRRYPDGTPRTKHVTTNVVVEVDAAGATATARSYFTVLQQLDDFPLQVVVAGRYQDSFARVAGAWQFTRRRMLVDLQGDLSRHLLVTLPRSS